MKLTPERLSAFCAALSETCNVGKACAAVGISRMTAYNWRDDIPEFKDAWDKALAVGVTALEDEAHRRGFEGTDEPVFHLGAQCGTVRKYSDTLAIFLLKAHAPEKYRENSKIDLTNSDGKLQPVDDTARSARVAQLLAIAAKRKAGEDLTDDDFGDLA